MFPEALDLLEYAKSQGKKCYIYTHSGSVVNQIMEHMGIEHYFSFVLDGSHGFPAKPAPNALNYLAEKFALDPKQCMMIGDRPIDAHAGMNAGMIGCLWDNDGLFPDAAVDHLVANLSEIKKLI